MRKKKTLIVMALAVVIAAVLLITHMPKRIEGTMTVSSGTGETAQVDYNILYFPNLILPSYVKGTISVDGVAYTDQYTMLKQFPGVSDNRLFPSDWWKAKGSLPCNMTFLRSDCTDSISAALNKVNILDIVLDENICSVHYMYTDENNQVDTNITGISFWGPAQNSQEAKQIADSFGYQTP